MGDRSVILKPLPYKLGVILSLQTTSTTHWPVRRSELLVGISTKSNSKRVAGAKLSYIETTSPCSEQSLNKSRYSFAFCIDTLTFRVKRQRGGMRLSLDGVRVGCPPEEQTSS